MKDKLLVRSMFEKWAIGVIISFTVCISILLGVSFLIRKFHLPERYLLMMFIVCGAYYVYKIASIMNIICPKCKKPIIASAFFRRDILIFRNITNKCSNCGNDFNL